MLSKGHHFPNISLVVVLDADAGLFSSDFRGQEQMTQTLIQVSGRAGRGINSGEVIIQSRHPNHETLNLIASRSFKKLAQLQLLERQNTELPPFAHLCLLRGESKYLKDAYEFLNSILALSNSLKLANKHDIVRLGPIPAPREKKAGRFRVHLILKSKTRSLLQNHLKEVIALVFERGIPRKVRFHVDVDPIEML
jgi:primosomal protein N' (replication factor Y)